jgi:hypothetical protein
MENTKQEDATALVPQWQNRVGQSFSICGTRTTSGSPAIVQWNTGLVRKTNQRIKD